MSSGKSGDGMRAFVAILLKPSVAEQAAQWQVHLKQAGVCGHFTARENLHLTLVFLGQTDRIDAALQAMRQAAGSAFALTIEQGGSFKKRGGEVLWMGVRRSTALMALQSRLCERLRLADFALEERPYVPHITLGRRMTLPLVGRLSPPDWPIISQPVQEICLMESTRLDGCLRYISRASVPLFPC